MRHKQQFWNSLKKLLARHNKVRANGTRASFSTEQGRRGILYKAFHDLEELGFSLEDVSQFKERHVARLAKHWETNGLRPGTLQTRISVLRVFANIWLGKAGMVRDNKCYFSSKEVFRRTNVATHDKSWDGNGVSYEQILERVREKDEFVAMALEMMHAFGLRRKEAVMFQPHLSDEGILVKIFRGAKGGRKRAAPILTEQQHEVLSRARKLVRYGDSLAGTDRTLKQALSHFSYILRQVGVNKKQSGVTPNGLRHGYVHKRHVDLAGVPPPIKSNAAMADFAIEKQARTEIAEELGHSRISVTNAYFGIRKKA